MRMRNKFLGCMLGLLALTLPTQAQELQCDVVVNSNQVGQTSDKQIFTSMQREINEFMNTRRWTNQTYRPEERIRCKLIINITERNESGECKANVQVVTSRPVYGTVYESTLLSFVDKNWAFVYNEATPLQFSENAFTSHLASLLTFYAYVMIGVDNDSFALKGGSQAYDRAVQEMNNATAQGAANPGWQAFGDTRNRYWLITNLQDAQMEPVRTALYNYHRLGLDLMASDPEKARKGALEALTQIQQVSKVRPGAPLIRSFFEAKSGEIVNFLKGGQPADKQAAYAVLAEVDPTNIPRYQAILK